MKLAELVVELEELKTRIERAAQRDGPTVEALIVSGA